MPYRRCTLAVAIAVVLCTAAPASAAAVRSQWTMDQANGTITDRLGTADITLTGAWSPVDGAVGRGIRFDYDSRASVGTAANSAGMNPGTDEFAVAVELKTDTVPIFGNYSPNVVQKGLFTDKGQWKMQLKSNILGTTGQCRFAGTRGKPMVNDSTAQRLDDGAWHKITCWRLVSSYGITVDGETTSVTGNVGSIANKKPLRVGSKTPTAGVEDQFQGTLDCVAYQIGNSARELAESTVPC